LCPAGIPNSIEGEKGVSHAGAFRAYRRSLTATRCRANELRPGAIPSSRLLDHAQLYRVLHHLLDRRGVRNSCVGRCALENGHARHATRTYEGANDGRYNVAAEIGGRRGGGSDRAAVFEIGCNQLCLGSGLNWRRPRRHSALPHRGCERPDQYQAHLRNYANQPQILSPHRRRVSDEFTATVGIFIGFRSTEAGCSAGKGISRRTNCSPSSSMP